MTLRRPASRLLFGVACLLLGGAAVTLLSAYILPYEGLQDLGRIVGALLLASIAAVPFLLALLVGRGTGMPLWMRLGSTAGLALGVLAALVFLPVPF